MELKAKYEFTSTDAEALADVLDELVNDEDYGQVVNLSYDLSRCVDSLGLLDHPIRNAMNCLVSPVPEATATMCARTYDKYIKPFLGVDDQNGWDWYSLYDALSRFRTLCRNVIIPALRARAKELAKKEEEREKRIEKENESATKPDNPCYRCWKFHVICGTDEEGNPSPFCKKFIDYSSQLTEEEVEEIAKSDPCKECPRSGRCGTDEALVCRSELAYGKVLLHHNKLAKESGSAGAVLRTSSVRSTVPPEATKELRG